MRFIRNVRSFTLIELLVVIVVITLLVVIVVPCFLKAHIRAQVSHARTDMQIIANALDAYGTANTRYPEALEPFLTTPVAYLTRVPIDRFAYGARRTYGYTGWPGWRGLYSAGPDGTYDCDPSRDFSYPLTLGAGDPWPKPIKKEYDPTNGTRSSGDIYLLSPLFPHQRWPDQYWHVKP